MTRLNFIGLGAACFTAILLAQTVSLAEGPVTSRACPYSCRTEGIDKKNCRDWREGNVCYIEDLRYPASGAQQRGEARVNASCSPDENYPPPRIAVSDEQPVGDRRDRIEVRGAVEGRCIREAGYYEDGNLVQSIPVSPDDQFRRFEFEIRGRSDPDRRAEVRAYSVNGERSSYPVGQESYRARPREDIYPRSGSDYDYDRGRDTPSNRIGEAVDDLLGGRGR